MPQSDFVLACDAAIARCAAANAAQEASDTPETEAAVEVACDVLNGLMDRAAVEPSACLGDLAAKARLHLDYLARVDGLDNLDAEQRLAAAVMRDVLALLPYRAAAPAGSTGAVVSCEAARIGAIIAETTAEILYLDHVVETERDQTARDNAQRRLDKEQRCVDALRAAISGVRAASPSGILAQLVVAFDQISTTYGGSTPETRTAGHERAELCLLSAANALCRLCGLDRKGCGADAMMPISLDRLALLDREEA